MNEICSQRAYQARAFFLSVSRSQHAIVAAVLLAAFKIMCLRDNDNNLNNVLNSLCHNNRFGAYYVLCSNDLSQRF